MCCAAQKCRVTKLEHSTKNLELPKDDVELPKGVTGEWCGAFFTEDIVYTALKKIQTCYLRCKLGYYNEKFGNAMLYSCQANRNRRQAFGISPVLESCSGIESDIQYVHLGSRGTNLYDCCFCSWHIPTTTLL